jgi:hypothetical protein
MSYDDLKTINDYWGEFNLYPKEDRNKGELIWDKYCYYAGAYAMFLLIRRVKTVEAWFRLEAELKQFNVELLNEVFNYYPNSRN